MSNPLIPNLDAILLFTALAGASAAFMFAYPPLDNNTPILFYSYRTIHFLIAAWMFIDLGVGLVEYNRLVGQRNEALEAGVITGCVVEGLFLMERLIRTNACEKFSLQLRRECDACNNVSKV
jgi:hypothetical protein